MSTLTVRPADNMLEGELAARYRSMQRYLGWTSEDARRVAALAPLVMPSGPALIADFYREIARHPEAMGVITGGDEQVARLSCTLREWLVELLAGNYDERYMERRWKVGHRHVEIGLAQRYVALALSRLRAGIIRCIEEKWEGDPAGLRASIRSMHKLLDIENALIQDAYEYEHTSRTRLVERERSERRFRHLVESASCLIVILDAGHKVVYFNPFAERITGFSIDDLRENPERMAALLGSDEAAGPLGDILATAASTSYEQQIAGRTGSPRWINWTLSRIDDFDGGPAVLAVGHDVTETRLASEQVLQSSRLATIGEMYTRLAHESRNALQRLRACTDMLVDHLSDRPAASALLQRSERAQEDLQRLLDEVRSFAAPIVIEQTECRLAALMREAWSLLQVQRQGRQTRFDESGCDPALTISADRFRMVQAFRNIFENSLSVCVDPVIIRVACHSENANDGARVTIAIEDNGPGFSTESQHRAFQPFFTTKSAGTGLGLAIVRRVVESHGGIVAAMNAADGGARICITMPAAGELRGGAP